MADGVSSKALQVNLEATEGAVTVDAKYLPLQEALESLPGLRQQIQALLCELSHPYKNWSYVVPELRDYALRYFSTYYGHHQGPQVVRVILNEWLDAVTSSSQQSVQTSALDSIIFFVEKLMDEGKNRLCDCQVVLAELFERLIRLPDEQFLLLSSGYFQIKRVGQIAANLPENEFDPCRLNQLLIRALKSSYQYWLAQEDPAEWLIFEDADPVPPTATKALFQHISHPHLRQSTERLSRIEQSGGQKVVLTKLLALPSYGDIVNSYHKLPQRIEELQIDTRTRLIGTLQCLLKILEVRGLSSIHQDTLGRLKRCIGAIIQTNNLENIEGLLRRTFQALRRSMEKFPEAALRATEEIGREVFQSNDRHMVEIFVRNTTGLRFQPPRLRGTTKEWKVQVNPAHLVNIKAWLRLIENNPEWSKKLISALIINLKLCGVYVKDTDLFQKEITLLLNSPIAPVYGPAKQLAKLFPVYFNEINAEGVLRDVSTEMDELVNRGDALIHFFRKQSHVESNSLLIEFALGIIDFWQSKDKQSLAPYVPAEVLAEVKDKGPYIDGVHGLLRHLFQKAGVDEGRQLLDLDAATLRNYLSEVPKKFQVDRERLFLLIRFLRLLSDKYSLTHFHAENLLKGAAVKKLPRTDYLAKAFRSPDLYVRLQGILDYLKRLKQIILSSERFQMSEDIYRKRHIAADIPSMYGTYYERKFDALGFSFRLENLANLLFEELMSSIDLTIITRKTLHEIANCMHLLVQAMELDGIVAKPLKDCLEILTHALQSRGFSMAQHVDILTAFSRAEQHVLYTHYTSVYKEDLARIVRQLKPKEFLPKYGVKEGEEITEDVINKVSETFFRDVVATAFGFQYLDNFVSKVVHALGQQPQGLHREDTDPLLTYDPGRTISRIQEPLHSIAHPIYLGSKGYNLTALNALNMPVPKGFIITTDSLKALEVASPSKQACDDFRAKIFAQIRHLEETEKKAFGDPTNPLLLSVRSGAAISLPGMMSTFLNVGLNEKIVNGLIEKTGKPWFAWDNYRRYVQSWAMSHNMERHIFHGINTHCKDRYGVKRKREFRPEQMREVALAYREAALAAGVPLVDDPYEQLFQAIRQVCYSWNTDRAKVYRDIMGISDDWGTAVTVQNMVYGNLSEQAGSGVVLTHNPHGSLDEVTLWGDYTTRNQGEDVVSGLVKTDPISVKQRTEEGRDQDHALEERFPEIFEALAKMAKQLVYEGLWGPQEIEFTFEGPSADRLYLLQSRDMFVPRRRRHPAFVPSFQLKGTLLARGIGGGGGALCGKAVFSREDIAGFRSQEPNTPLILIRFDTVPDDIREISATEGLLTSRGGATSHASIVAHQLERTCVVGCSELVVHEKAGYGIINGHTLRTGDYLSIDGQNGFVYRGQHEIQQ